MTDAPGSELLALTVSCRMSPSTTPLLCLAILIDYGNDRSGYYDLGGYGFICSSATDTYGSLEYVLPLKRAIDRGWTGEPFEAFSPERGWMDVGLSLRRSEPPPAPLLFNISAVPSGIWWLHTASAVTTIEVWRSGQ
jgi:hypothetical protein